MPRSLTLVAAVLVLAGCASVPSPRSTTSGAPPASGKYYLDDGPGLSPPADLDVVPDAVPKIEPLHRAANRPYAVFGREYVPATSLTPYRERGVASWYGRKFHGQKTSIGEPYDMYAMTAAHPTLPLPSYARVTNVASGKSVIVRVNDRGPFLHDRIIDLSYAAAYRLGIAQRGSGEVEVEAILPETLVASAQAKPPLPAVADAPPIAQPLAPMADATVVTQPIAPVSTAPAVAQPAASVGPAQPPLTADAAPVAPMQGGYSVQLGAFANSMNAQAFLDRVQNQLANMRVEAKIRRAGGLYRVYIGPYAGRSEAQRVGERITGAFGFPTTIAAH
jgi:peptidoglycan lytic transglycosylase